MKRNTLIATLVLGLASSLPAQPALEQIWQLEGLDSPESVLFDAGSGTLFVANIGGTAPWEKDGNGSISRVSLDGKLIEKDWITGLDSAKGMGMFNGRLYVADIERVAVIDVAAGRIERMIAVPGAQTLNDLTVAGDGTVYVSDSRGRKVYSIRDGKAEVFLDESVLRGPNGLLAVGDALLVLDNSAVHRVGPDRKPVTLVSGLEAGLDGIVQVQGDDYVVTSARGVIYHVNLNGSSRILADTRPAQMQTADLAFNSATKTIYVPTLFTNKVVAYRLQ